MNPFLVPYRTLNALLFTKAITTEERYNLVTYVRRVTDAANEYQGEIINLKREVEKLQQENRFLTQQLQEESMSHPGMTPEEGAAYLEMLEERKRNEEKFTPTDDPEEKLDSDDDSVVK